MKLSYFAIPIITGLIGWVTNVIAVKMLFRPKKPLRLGFMTIQGVVPKRKEALAKSISEIFDRELLNTNDLVERLRNLELSDEVTALIDGKLDSFIARIKEAVPMASMFLSQDMINKLKGLAMEELMSVLPEVKERIAQGIEDEFEVKAFIEDKIRTFSLEQLESITMHVATKELRTIEVLGGLLGFVIGLLQLFFMVYTGI